MRFILVKECGLAAFTISSVPGFPSRDGNGYCLMEVMLELRVGRGGGIKGGSGDSGHVSGYGEQDTTFTILDVVPNDDLIFLYH